ncbi:hypothetical protein Cgig2_008368 [Carnegiea gigantea]|uniref:Uncharacterized protein n=1 Tax=Carnegiea gigantea TaxID=171969 RepID=A0A9Q1KAN0_9CARY|nr:hypothetical protein Cgig2_008368 [Carnegiea gigantea]
MDWTLKYYGSQSQAHGITMRSSRSVTSFGRFEADFVDLVICSAIWMTDNGPLGFTAIFVVVVLCLASLAKLKPTTSKRLKQGDILDHVKYRGSTSRETNNDPSNFVGQDDVEGLLRAAFGVDIPGSRDDIVHDVVDKPLDEGVKPFDMKRGCIFLDNNMELKRVKEELASQKAMFLLMLKAVSNGKITNEFLDATEAAYGW